MLKTTGLRVGRCLYTRFMMLGKLLYLFLSSFLICKMTGLDTVIIAHLYIAFILFLALF